MASATVLTMRDVYVYILSEDGIEGVSASGKAFEYQQGLISYNMTNVSELFCCKIRVVFADDTCKQHRSACTALSMYRSHCEIGKAVQRWFQKRYTLRHHKSPDEPCDIPGSRTPQQHAARVPGTSDRANIPGLNRQQRLAINFAASIPHFLHPPPTEFAHSSLSLFASQTVGINRSLALIHQGTPAPSISPDPPLLVLVSSKSDT